MVFKTADVVKAEGGVGFGQKGLMMELQSLQEALKVEIQIHQKLVAQMKQDPQNAELKLQLHDLQAKITALSERQKKVVEQLRRDLLVKQESGELRLQTQTQLPLQADGKTTTLVSNQSQSSLPPAHLSTPQNSVSVTPVIATKTLPLMLRAATPTTPIAMMPTPTIAMVTTLTNTPLPSLPNSDPQNLPVSLQTSCKPTNQGMEPVRIVSKNTIVVQTATQPIKVPQFVPPTRQTTRPSSLPQVMPKPPATVASAGLQPVLASPQPLQQPVFLTAKLSSTLLPSSGPVHQLHIFNPLPAPPNPPPGPAILQPCSSVPHTGPPITQTLPAVAMTPSTSLNQCVMASVHHCGSQFASSHSSTLPSKDQQCSTASTSPETPPSALPSKGQQYSADSASPETPPSPQSSTTCPTAPTLSGRVEPKTVRSSPTPHPVAPQSPASTSSTPATHSQANTHDPALAQSTVPKRQDNPLKLAFMVSLGLVTHEYLEEIQSKRQERKRRTTANPVYSGAVFEPERKKNTVSYLNSANQACKKRADDDGLSEGDIHDDFCVVCRRSGQLLMCDACSRVYHLDCLAPALRTCPRGMWICPSCQNQMSKKDEPIDWPGPLAIVHSYISYKAEREEEKQKLEKWSSELRQEREELELRVKQLSDSITICRESRNGVLERQKEMEASMEKVKGLVCLIRGIQLPSPTVMSNGGLDHAVPPHPSTPSEQIQHPSTPSEQIQHPSTPSEQIQHPSTPSEQTQHPSTLTEQTQHPSTLTEQTQHPSTLTEQTQHPSTPSEQTQHPSTLSEQTQHPSEQCSGKVSTLADPSSCRTDSGSCTEFTKIPAVINHLPVGKSAVVTGPNGALEPGGDEHGESVNRNDTGDVNKNNTDVNKNNADVNRYSIRDLRGSPVKTLAEVIQGAE